MFGIGQRSFKEKCALGFLAAEAALVFGYITSSVIKDAYDPPDYFKPGCVHYFNELGKVQYYCGILYSGAGQAVIEAADKRREQGTTERAIFTPHQSLWDFTG